MWFLMWGILGSILSETVFIMGCGWLVGVFLWSFFLSLRVLLLVKIVLDYRETELRLPLLCGCFAEREDRRELFSRLGFIQKRE